jgi:hypothetical protein
LAVSVELRWDRISSLGLRIVRASATQEGVLGGPDLDTPRMGDRFAADLGTTRLKQDSQSRLLIADLLEGLSLDVRTALRMPTRSRLLGGALVDGNGQVGSLLKVRSLQPGSGPARGDFFSIVHDGRHYVHMATAQVIAGADGKATIPILPMLRFITADGERVALDAPMIEGRLVGFDQRGAQFTRNRTEPLSFSIVERR